MVTKNRIRLWHQRNTAFNFEMASHCVSGIPKNCIVVVGKKNNTLGRK